MKRLGSEILFEILHVIRVRYTDIFENYKLLYIINVILLKSKIFLQICQED